MKTKILALMIALAASGALAQSTTYYGNGNTAWGGAVGTGSLNVSVVGTNITFTFYTGSGSINPNDFVIYLDCVGGGFADTTSLADAADGGRQAVSGFSGSQRSTLDFTSGFNPDYAISIEGGYASLFQLNSGGNNSLTWITGASQSGGSTYSLTFSLTDLGVTPGSGQTIELFGLEVSTSGYSSPEAIGGGLTGSSGWGNTQIQTAYSNFTVSAVPEPSTFALCGMSGLAWLHLFRRRR